MSLVRRLLVLVVLMAGLLALPAAASASSVIAPTVSLSTTTGAASGVTYTLDFTVSSALASGSDTITVALPTGTVIPDANYTLTDLASDTSIGLGGLSYQNGKATATATVFDPVPAGHRLELSLYGVTNAPSGNGQAQVSTSTDTAPAGTSPFTLTAPSSVSTLQVTASTLARGATGVAYNLTFATSPGMGGLISNQGTISLTLPDGASVADQNLFIHDLTSGQDIYAFAQTSGNPVTWVISGDVAAGDKLELPVTGVTNPSSGSGQISVSTSSDPATVSSPSLTYTPANSVSAVNVTPTSTAQGATGVEWGIDFTASSTGKLAYSPFGTTGVTVSLPSGSVVASGTYTGVDLTTGKALYGQWTPSQNDPASGTWSPGSAIDAGDEVGINLVNVTNPPAPSTGGKVTIQTASDTVPASSSTVSLGAPKAVSSPIVLLSSNALGATGVTYGIDFKLSSTGGLDLDNGTVTLTLPTGSVIPSQTVNGTDVTTGQQLYFSVSGTQGAQTTLSLSSGSSLPPGHEIAVSLTGVTNPTTAPSSNQVVVKTSSDTVSASSSPVSYATATGVSNLSVTPSTTAEGATGVSYSVDFQTSQAGGLSDYDGTFTVTLPTSAITATTVYGQDLTSGQGLYANLLGSVQNGTTATYQLSGYRIAPGDHVQFTLTGATNAASSGGTVQVATSSDTVAKSPATAVTLVPPQALTNVFVTPTTDAAGVGGVGYQIGLTTSSTGALGPSAGTITITLPGGNIPHNTSLMVRDLTSGTTDYESWNSTSTSTKASWTVANDIAAGDTVVLEISGITNPAAGAVNIGVQTSSDSPTTVSHSYSAPKAVASPRLAVSNLTASTTATYSVDFTASASGGLASNQGKITVNLPSGSSIPQYGGSGTVTDLTTDRVGFTGSPVLTNTGASGTWITPITIDPGDRVRIAIPGVTNPASGTVQASISSTSDSATPAATTSSYSIGGSLPTAPTSSIFTSDAAGATGVTYEIGLTMGASGLPAGGSGGTIRLQAPAGTLLPQQRLEILDVTTGTDLGSTSTPSTAPSNDQTYSTTLGLPANHQLMLKVPAVTNPAAGSGAITVTIAAAGSAAGPLFSGTTPTYTIGPAGSVTSPSVQLSSKALGARGVTYTVGFTTSASGGLEDGAATVTVQVPGSVTSQQADFYDVTAGEDLGSHTPTIGGGGTTATYLVPRSVPAGHALRLTMPGITNPASSGGSVSVMTSSDPTPASVSLPALASATHVISPTAIPGSLAQSAKGVFWDVEFTTSATGALSANQSTITVTLPAGAIIPNTSVYLYDVTTGANVGYGLSPSGSGNTMTWTVTHSVPASHRLAVQLSGVTNPSGAGAVSVSTSTDTSAATSSLTFVAAQPVKSVTASASSLAAGAKGVTYAVAFTTSSTGALTPGGGTITITLPSGTTVNSGYSVALYDLAGGNAYLGGANVTGGNVVTFTVAVSMPANHRFIVEIFGVTSATTGGSVSVSTSADSAASSSTVALSTAGPVSAVTARESAPVQGAPGVNVHVSFTLSATGALVGSGGTITITLPSGSTIPSYETAQLIDLTTHQYLGYLSSLTSTAGNTMTWAVNQTLNGGDRLQIDIFNVTNAGTGDVVKVLTSSDTQSSSPVLTLNSPQSVGTPSVTLTSPTQGATGVGWVVEFMTSLQGALESNNGSVTLTFPNGTSFTSQAIDFFDVTDHKSLYQASATYSGSPVTIQVPTDLPSGHLIRLTIPSVTNGTTSGGKVTVATSSDPTPTSSAGVTLSPSGSVTPDRMALSDPAAGASGVTYRALFTTSAAGGVQGGSGTVTFTPPAGTSFDTSKYVDIRDLTVGRPLDQTNGTFAGGKLIVPLTNSSGLMAGHLIGMTIHGVTNPSAGTYAWSIATSSDLTPVTTAPFTVGTPTAAASPTVALSSPAPSAGGVTYTLGLRVTTALPAGGTITAYAPSGTNWPNAGVDITDTTAGQDLGTTPAPTRSDGNATATWALPSGKSVPAGHALSVSVPGTTNPVAGLYEMEMATSTDTSPAQTPSYSVASGPPPPRPTVTGLTPSSGLTSGGTQVTITGTNLAGVQAVNFGTAAGTSVHTNADGSVTATTPPEQAGIVDVTVTTPGGTSVPNPPADQFTFVAPRPPPVSGSAPSISSINPGSGSTAGGTSVTIAGSNFTGTTAVSFGAAGPAASYHVDTDGQITAVSPAGSPGTVSVTVTNPYGSSNGASFTYVSPPPPPPAPSVTGVSPAAGPTAGGTAVTIAGAHFTSASAVKFGAKPATSFKVGSDTKITATSPPGSEGAVDVTVTGPNGTSATVGADRFTYQAPPAVDTPDQPVSTVTVTATAAAGTADGTVNPMGLPTTAHFEYGLDPSLRTASDVRSVRSAGVIYDQSTPDQNVGSDKTAHHISADLPNLVPNAIYHVRLVAANSAGTSTSSDQTFTTPKGPKPPPPKLGKTEDVKPAGGLVLIKIGGKFVPLTQAEPIPTGAVLDTRRGTVQLTAARAGRGKTETGTFNGAIFSVTQAASGPLKGITTLSLLVNVVKGGPSFAVCKHAAADRPPTARAAALSKRLVALLHARDHGGHFRTRGRYSAATARGTQWDTADRCDGTLTTVHQGSVLVEDFVKHAKKLVRAGHSYLATLLKLGKRRP